ncbi:MAG: DUF6734 family protein [Roseiflexaceae bacterium]
MKAVWSFWSKPFDAHRRHSWPSVRHHLFAWVLSVETARMHYPETCLVTDDAGARLLVDGIGLRFKHVSTELNTLDQHNPDWWALGKIYAYSMQTEPFAHIDSDVFLWKPLPERLARADVFAQNPEPISASTPYYQPERLEQALGAGTSGWLPDEWRWYRRARDSRAECCGIFGGNRIDFINRFATAALRLIDDPANIQALRSLQDKSAFMPVIEQYLLSAFVEYHKASAVLPLGSVQLEYLFHSIEDAWNPDSATQAGFTHLVAGAKQNRLFAERLEHRVRRDYPEYYRRCIACID